MFDKDDVPKKILSKRVVTITKNGKIYTYVQCDSTLEDFIEQTKEVIKQLK